MVTAVTKELLVACGGRSSVNVRCKVNVPLREVSGRTVGRIAGGLLAELEALE